MVDEGYIRRLQDALNARAKAEDAKTENENREAAFLKSETPKDWVKLKDWLRESVNQVAKGAPANTLVYEDGDDLDEAKIRSRIGTNTRQVTITFFNLFNGQITVGGCAELSFDAEVGEKRVEWVDSSDQKPCTIDEIGKKILDSVVKP